MNKTELNKLVNTSLTGTEVLNIVNNKANLFTYTQLRNMKHLNEILDPWGAAFILYQTTKPNYGHWVALIRNGANKICFFDSYGYMPDEELKWTREDLVKPLHQNYDVPKLTALLYESGLDIEYNEYQLQEKGKPQTCGRWSAARILNKHLNTDEFAEEFKPRNGYTSDQLVTLYTENI